MLKVCIVGLGRTGKEIAKALLGKEDIKIVMAVCSPGSNNEGKELGSILGTHSTNVIVESSEYLAEKILKYKPDVAIDFSSPKATVRNAKIFSEMHVDMVIGTTGFSKIDQRRLFVTCRNHKVGIVMAPNITLGVNVLMLLSNITACIMSNYDFEIVEVHHKYKKDAPSGTAIKIMNEILKGFSNVNGSSEAVNAINKSVNISAIRTGGVIGKHEVMVVGEDDKIEIIHEAFSRKAFAEGAYRAAKFIKGKTGFYEMSDVLDLKNALNTYIEKEINMKSRKYKYFNSKNTILEKTNN